MNVTKERPFKSVKVEMNDGKIVSVSDLNKEDYEYFLDLIHSVRIAYIAIVESKEREKV